MDYLMIALLPAIPVVGVGLFAQRKRTLHITAAIMCGVGVLAGNPAFAVIDVVTVGLAWLALANLREWPESAESDRRS